MKKLCVGVSLFSTPDANIWSNGINQNIAFLVMLLRQVPTVGQIYLLNGGDAEALSSALEFDQLDAPLVAPHQVSHELDVVIEMGAKLPVEWMRHMQALGVKRVLFHVGHAYNQIMEQAIFERATGSAFNDIQPDEVWSLQKDVRCINPLLRTVTRAPVFTMPHLWSPAFLVRKIAELECRGQRFGFAPTQRAAAPGRPAPSWRLGIFEPNISVTKCCFMPMLICEQAYRRQPASVALMMVMNSFHMKEHPTFNRFASHLSLTRDHKASYEPRVVFAECMAAHALDAVVSHHWENGQNYLFYDALYGGYPLIHNAEILRDENLGIYYPGFEAVQGGNRLAAAWEQPAEFWIDETSRAHAYLKRLAPDHEPHVRTFMARLHRADQPAPEVTP